MLEAGGCLWWGHNILTWLGYEPRESILHRVHCAQPALLWWERVTIGNSKECVTSPLEFINLTLILTKNTKLREGSYYTLNIIVYATAFALCFKRINYPNIFAKTRHLHKLSPHDSVVAFRMQSKLRSSRSHLTSEIILVTIAAPVLRSAALCSIVGAELLSRRHNKIEFTQYFRISTLSWGERRGRAPDYQVWFGHHSSPTPPAPPGTSPTCLFSNW